MQQKRASIFLLTKLLFHNMALKLKATERSKRRYLLIDGASREIVENTILDYLGILGWAKAAPFFVEHTGREIVLAVERISLNDVKAALALSPSAIRVIRVSGTLKGLRK